MGKAIDDLNEHKREIIKDFLAQFPDGYVEKFNRIFGSIDTIDPDKMEGAISLCERTFNNLKEKDKKTD